MLTDAAEAPYQSIELVDWTPGSSSFISASMVAVNLVHGEVLVEAGGLLTSSHHLAIGVTQLWSASSGLGG